MLGTCKQKAPLGTGCTADVQCAPPGHCADGFCCNQVCDGICQACNVAGNPGQCLPLGGASPEPPRHAGITCAGSPTSCQGVCTGNTQTCTFPRGLLDDGGVDPAKTLGLPECVTLDGGTRLSKYPCNGAGSSIEVDSTCGGYRCLDAHTCRTTCTHDSDCIEDHICVLGDAGPATCELLTGPLCDGDVTLRRPIAHGGNIICPNHYACPSSATACNTTCKSVSDCAPSFICDNSKTCVSGLAPPALPNCTTGRVTERRGRDFGGILALAVLGGLASRRRRPAVAVRHSPTARDVP